MKKLNVMAVMVAALMLPVALGPAAAADDRVLGEKLDSGLGELASDYTAAEFMPKTKIVSAER